MMNLAYYNHPFFKRRSEKFYNIDFRQDGPELFTIPFPRLCAKFGKS